MKYLLTIVLIWASIIISFAQSTSAEDTSLTVKEHENVTLSYKADISLSDMSFQWYKDNEPLFGQSERDLFIEDISYVDSGAYYVRVKSDQFSENMSYRQSGTWVIHVEDSIQESQCIGVYDYHIDKITNCDSMAVCLRYFTAESQDLTIKIVEKTKSTTYELTPGDTIAIDSGSYNFQINDPFTCGVQLWDIFSIAPSNNCYQPEPCIGNFTSDIGKVETCENTSILFNSFECENTNTLYYTFINQHSLEEYNLIPGDSVSVSPGRFDLHINDNHFCKFEIENAIEVQAPNNCNEPMPCIGSYDYYIDKNVTCSQSELTLIAFECDNTNTLYFQTTNSRKTSETFQVGEPIPIAVGDYTLIVTDSLECTFVIDNAITIDKATGCEKIFSPDGDGVNDKWLIEGVGTVRISNMEGTLVRTFSLPAEWDGTDETGHLLPIGLYLIVFDDGSIQQVSLVK